jgi:uncharacterized protein YbjQ (UPF0145 family)
MDQLVPIIIVLILIIVGYTSGRIVESKHYQSIETREKQLLHLPAVTMKNALDPHREIARVQLVTGSAVISVDYFKRFLAGLRNFFGGRVSSYETLIDRARREAILRMKEATKKADIILNLRIETSSISKGAKQTIGSIEALAYGTAISYKPGSSSKPRARTSVSQTSVEEPPPVQAPPSSVQPPPPETRYKVVFSGEIIAGQELETVKKRVAALYKVPVERCESMFSGHLVTVKDDLDYPTAQKYQKAFERAGAICRIEPL